MFLCVTCVSCKMKKTEKPLPGKIAVEDIMHHVCTIYDNSDSAAITFKIKNEQDVHYNGFTWLNRKDSLVGSEYIAGQKREDYKGNIATFDTKGNLAERLYMSKPGEIAGLIFSSRNDKYLLFTTDTVGDIDKNPFEGLTRMNSIMIMDLQKRKIIRVFKDVGIMPGFTIHESPWLFDETRFVYSYTRPEGYDQNNKYDSSGVYICDIGNGQKKLLIPNAYFPICSPTSLKIAYIKDQALRVLNLETKNSVVIFDAAKNIRFRDIHWTPDGEYIYLAYFSDYPFGMFFFHEKLIDVATGESIPFKKIDFGLFAYSWK